MEDFIKIVKKWAYSAGKAGMPFFCAKNKAVAGRC